MSKVTTLIFDVDDTLYDVETGFSAHRNGPIVHQYMVDHLKFSSLEEAKQLRDEYFAKYHATAKALTVAQQEGKFPKDAPQFNTQHLAEYWANNLDYSILGEPKTELKQKFQELQTKHGLNLVAFSNGPKAYVKRVLQKLDMFDLFGDERLYAVDDVLPYCKPEKEAFDKILSNLEGKPTPDTCVMVEDSMKNVRAAKAIGMKTVLVTGRSEQGRILPEDKPEITDATADCSMAVIEDFPKILPGLWSSPAVFDPQPKS